VFFDVQKSRFLGSKGPKICQFIEDSRPSQNLKVVGFAKNQIFWIAGSKNLSSFRPKNHRGNNNFGHNIYAGEKHGFFMLKTGRKFSLF